MALLVTPKQGGAQFTVYDRGKPKTYNLPVGRKAVVDKASTQLENLKKAGIIGLRKATKSEESNYPKLSVQKGSEK